MSIILRTVKMLNSETYISLNVDALPQFKKIFLKLNNLLSQGETLMSAIQDFAVKQQAYNERMNAAVEGIRGDLDNLNEQIKKLQDAAAQNSEMSDEDKEALNRLEMSSQELADKLEQIDQLNAPALPPVDGSDEEDNASNEESKDKPEDNVDAEDEVKEEKSDEVKSEDDLNNKDEEGNEVDLDPADMLNEDKKDENGVAAADTEFADESKEEAKKL